ncbi:hypothetical protein EDD86DRAFT_201018 [Gorgonomyces haynaldii]|nr:hypothetical protein EDD86DRAFT_201018 [Gorgonomyces haynaldii]
MSIPQRNPAAASVLLCSLLSFALVYFNSPMELLFAIPALIGSLYVFKEVRRAAFFMTIFIGCRMVGHIFWTGYWLSLYFEAMNKCANSKSDECQSLQGTYILIWTALGLNVAEILVCGVAVVTCSRLYKYLKDPVMPFKDVTQQEYMIPK